MYSPESIDTRTREDVGRKFGVSLVAFVLIAGGEVFLYMALNIDGTVTRQNQGSFFWGFAAVAVAVPVVYLLFSTAFFTVSQNTVAIVERFGMYTGYYVSGLGVKLPFGIDIIAGIVDLRVKICEMSLYTRTSDNAFIKICAAVRYSVCPTLPARAFYRMADPHLQIRRCTEAAIRQQTAIMTMDEVFKNRKLFDTAVSQAFRAQIDYGYEMESVFLLTITPSTMVRTSANAVSSARYGREAAQDRGEIERTIIAAKGQGIAEGLKAVVGVFKKAVVKE